MTDNATHAAAKMEAVASLSFPAHEILVDVVDFLNKSIRNDGYIFGVSKSGEKMTISIYETDRISRAQ